MNRSPIQCIIPPHIMDALLNSPEERVRESALAAIKLSAFMRGRRSVLGTVFTAIPAAVSHGLNRTIFNCNHSEPDPPTGSVARKEGQPATGNLAVDQAYDGFGDTYKLYSEIFHRDSIDGQGLPLLGYVHYGNGFNNAFWDGAEMVFGDGDGIIFQSFTRSLDVIGHELAHGVTEKTAGLVYHNQPGALNESFSDVFGSLVKQYKLKQNAASADWLIGAELLAPGIHGKALRSMADPGSAYNDPKLGGKDPQPGHMKDYVNLPDNRSGDWGGVHYNSGIPNHAFYLLATRLGGNAWDVPGKIWYTALQQLNSNSQFQDCAEITCQVASTIYGNGSTAHQATIEAWDEVGLSFSGAQDRFAGRKKVGKNKAPTFNNDVLKQQLEKLAEALENTIEAMA